MLTYFTTPVRSLLLAAALAFAAQAADVRADDRPQTTTAARTSARTRGDADTPDRDGVPVGGVLIIAGVVGVVILLAWVCSRVSDNRRPMMM